MAKKLTRNEWESRLVDKLNGRATLVGWVAEGVFGAKAKVSLRCDIDGQEWASTPDSIMRGSGCPRCAGNVADNTMWEKVIRDALEGRAVMLGWVKQDEHSARSKVKMKCSICNHMWEAAAHRAAAGRGCQKCSRKNITANEWEILISNKMAGRAQMTGWAKDGKTGSKRRVAMRCLAPSCQGEWSPVVNELMRGSGCPYCAAIVRRTPQSEREAQINAIPNIAFVAWPDGYSNQYSKPLVRCLRDGHEWQAALYSLIGAGHGCPKCAGNYRHTQSEREKQIDAIPNIEFLSWETMYKGHNTKALVRCRIDNKEWSASVSNLMRGHGCPSCAKHGFDPTKPGTLYVLRSECGQHVKIGISNNSTQRIATLRRHTPFEFATIEQLHFKVGAGARALEVEAHATFESAGFEGYDGATEWVKFTPEILQWLSQKRREIPSNSLEETST